MTADCLLWQQYFSCSGVSLVTFLITMTLGAAILYQCKQSRSDLLPTVVVWLIVPVVFWPWVWPIYVVAVIVTVGSIAV